MFLKIKTDKKVRALLAGGAILAGSCSVTFAYAPADGEVGGKAREVPVISSGAVQDEAQQDHPLVIPMLIDLRDQQVRTG